MIWRLLIAALAVLVAATALVADDDLEVIELTVTPAGPPRPLLRYRFSPTERQLSEGNAAALYGRAIIILQQEDRDRQKRQSIYDWLERSIDEVPREEAQKTLSHFRSVLNEVRLATRRTRAEWDLPLAEQGIATLLPEIQEMRELVRVLTIEARVAILDGDYAQASRVLEDMYMMGEHLGEAGTLVSMLVGLAAQGMANEVVADWIAQPDSPNAYWALTSIADSADRLSSSLESEDLWIRGSIPYSDLLGEAILTPGQLDDISRAMISMLDSYRWFGLDSKWIGGMQVEFNSGETIDVRVPSRLALLPLVLRAYPVCKRQLLESDVDRELIELMEPMQVVMLRWVQVYRESLDEMVVWSRRPFVESRPAMKELDNRLVGRSRHPEAVLASLMLPAANAANQAVLRFEQRVAMLRTIEALRLYAAAHNGRLPGKLEEITEVTVPLDPVTGAAFPYRLEGGTAVLSSTERKFTYLDTRFEITISR